MSPFSPNTPATPQPPSSPTSPPVPERALPWARAEAELIRRAGELAGAISLQSLAELALAILQDSVPLDRASISLLDGLDGNLRLTASFGQSGARVGQNVTRPRSVSEWVLREARGLVLQGRVRTEQLQGVEDQRVQSSITLPLPGSRGSLGVLSLGRGGSLPSFENHDIVWAAAALEPLATALAHRLEMDRATRALADLHAAAFEPGAPWRTRPFGARGYECCVHVRRSWEIGGSFAASITREDGRSWLLVADPGGRGLDAVAGARLLEGIFLSAGATCSGVADLALSLDKAWGARADRRHPCVLWLASPGRAGLVECCTLGTTSLLRLQTGSLAAPVSGIAQPALGEPREVAPHVQTHRLLPGDVLAFSNLGLLEASDASGEPFGVERFRDSLQEHQSRPVEALARHIAEDALGHAGRSWWRSDLLVAVLRARRDDS